MHPDAGRRLRWDESLGHTGRSGAKHVPRQVRLGTRRKPPGGCAKRTPAWSPGGGARGLGREARPFPLDPLSSAHSALFYCHNLIRRTGNEPQFRLPGWFVRLAQAPGAKPPVQSALGDRRQTACFQTTALTEAVILRDKSGKRANGPAHGGELFRKLQDSRAICAIKQH